MELDCNLAEFLHLDGCYSNYEYLDFILIKKIWIGFD